MRLAKTSFRQPRHSISGPGFRRPLVLPVVDKVIDHRRIGERRGVAQIAELILGDLAQNSPHDLARACFRQAGRELDQVGRSNRADLLANPSNELLAEIFSWLLAGHQRDVCVDALALDIVRIANDRGFRDLGMCHQRALNLGSAKAVTGNVDDIVDAAGDPVVAVLRPAGSRHR